MPETYQIKHRGLDSTDASMYWSVQENLNRWGKPQYYGNGNNGYGATAMGSGQQGDSDDGSQNTLGGYSGASIGIDLSGRESIPEENMLAAYRGTSIGMDLSGRESIPEENEGHPLSLDGDGDGDGGPHNTKIETSGLLGNKPGGGIHDQLVEQDPVSNVSPSTNFVSASVSKSSQKPPPKEELPLSETIQKILKRCLQPPVIAATLGLLFAYFPAMRGILVDIEDRDGNAPLQWFFDGLFEVGKAAVPINMIILGCNLSASYMLNASSGSGTRKAAATATPPSSFSNKTIMMIVLGKMVIMPLVGCISALLLHTVYVVPQDIAGSLYLVLLVVFLCPTANNVMVMVELSSGGSNNDNNSGVSAKESMARIIAYQYAIAPVVLSGTVTGAVLLASHIAKTSP